MATETEHHARRRPTRKRAVEERRGASKKSPPAGSAASAPRASAPKRLTGVQVARSAARQLLELTGTDAEGVTGLERTEDGWKVQVEVVEVRRIPDTTDILAIYEVQRGRGRRAGGLPATPPLRPRGVPGED